MNSILRSLALAGILVAATVPAFADELVRTSTYSIDGTTIPAAKVVIEDVDPGFTTMWNDASTAIIRTQSAVVETKTTTRLRDETPTAPSVESVRVGRNSEYVVKELPAVIEDGSMVLPSQHSMYWPLLDYSNFNN